MAPERGFPLFPLEIVALPTEDVPLHIFEERYRTMIGECLENESEFGIVWAEADSVGDAAGVHTIGCAMRIAQVLERDDEGRLNISCVGTRPFAVIEMTDAEPYPAGVIEFLADEPEETDPELVSEAHDAYRAIVELATGRDPDPSELEGLSAYEMAAKIDFGPAAKQGLLGLRSESGRLRLFTQLTRALIKRLELADAARERARVNGKVRFDWR